MGRRNPPLQIKWSINAQNEDVPNGPSERVFFLYPFGRKEECYHPAPGGMGGDRGHGQFKGRWGHLLQGSWSNCSPRLHLTPLSTQRFHVWENSPPKPWHKSEGGFGETSAQLCLNRQKTSDSLMPVHTRTPPRTAGLRHRPRFQPFPRCCASSEKASHRDVCQLSPNEWK